MIAVIDYNMGNVGSILNMLKRLGHPAVLTREPDQLREADGLILPGVGSFDQGMSNLADLDLMDPLHECVQVHRVPVLGICLGMQLLTDGSEEGRRPGLGWIPGFTKRFNFSSATKSMRVPHMGWNHVQPVPLSADAASASVASSLFNGTEPEQKYYFVHSYHVCCEHQSDVLATAEYGHRVTASIGRGHIVGTQFHPEKSHRFGLKLMDNFGRSALSRTPVSASS